MTAIDDLSRDPVIEAYKKDVDRTLLRENLRRTPEERARNLMALQRAAEELHRVGRETRKQSTAGLRRESSHDPRT